VSANGGIPEVIVKTAGNEVGFAHPQILPDGKSVLFSRIITAAQCKIMVQSLKSGERKELFEGNAARYLPTGHIIYAVGSNLFAVRFDINALKVIGGPVPVVEGVLRISGAPQYAVSDSGTLVYVPRTETTSSPVQRTLVWVDRKGKEQSLAAHPNDYREPHISPDGTKLALSIGIGNGYGTDIWIWDIVRETMTRLTFNENSFYPLWTLDGRRVAFARMTNANNVDVFWKAADGTGGDEKLGSVPSTISWPCSWSSDGKILVTLEWITGRNDIELCRWRATINGDLCYKKNIVSSIRRFRLMGDGWRIHPMSRASARYMYVHSLR